MTEDSYARKEEEILKFWQENKIFEKTLQKTKNKKPYIFYDGPPFATGLPHYGHILASTIKDLVPRYFAMKGRRVDRKWGWDCHGLPIENLIEEELGINSRKEILEFGIEKFNQEAKRSVFKYAEEWEKTVNRIGRFVDFKNSYKTMDPDYMESVWWAFSELYKKGLIYQDCRISLFCPRCSTPLSNFEIAMDHSYKDRQDNSLFVKFRIKENKYFLVWTTTPWTLPANTGLVLNPDAEYLTVEKNGEQLIVAQEQKDLIKDGKIIKTQKGKDLIGLDYEPLYNVAKGRAYKTLGADFVEVKEGTGIVHIAPAFGEDDFNLGKKENLAMPVTLDETGRFKSQPEFLKGKTFLEANDLIIEDLKKRNLIFKKEKIVHSYPFCWRCEHPLIYMVQPAWFLSIEKIRQKLLELNEKIDWHPEHLKYGRFGKGIETAPDWNLSRSRFWGTPLPIWQCKDCKKYIVISSLEDLDRFSPDSSKTHNWPYNEEGEVDLHPPFIDEIKLKCRCKGEAERISDVFDCWFESGSMPFAQAHYPFEKDLPFPADFISEYIAQTRGWFYTLHVLSGALFEKPAFKHVITTGTILSEKGEKLSKSRKNFPDPWLIFDRYGVDSLRYYLMTSSVMLSENINFSEKEVKEVYQKLVSTLLNVLNYYKLYQKSASRRIKKSLPSQMDILDKWILSRLNNLIQNITRDMDAYETAKAQRPILDFVQDLSLWYLRMSRERIKNKDQKALSVLGFVLEEFSKLMAPITPFLAELVYQDAVSPPAGGSVHLEDWPEVQKKFIDNKLEEEMALTRKVVSLALKERSEAKIKVRQPLPKLKIKNEKLKIKEALLELIKQEVNIKEIIFDSKIKGEVELDIKITPALEREGMFRELVRQVQDMRKKLKLTPDQKIKVFIETDKKGEEFIKTYRTELQKAANIKSIRFSQSQKAEEIVIRDLKIKISINVVSSL